MTHPMIPPLIYGTAWKKERTAQLVTQALQAGFRGIDTACQPKHYDEARVGEGIERSGVGRTELFIQTKFTPLGGQDPARIPYDPTAPLQDQIEQSLQVSLANLRTSYLDSWVLHSPLASYALTLQAYRAMESGVDKQKVRALGISNCYDLALLERLYEDAVHKPRFVQNRFYADTDYDKTIRKWCDEHAIIYQSFWSLSVNPHLLSHPIITALIMELGKSAAQIWYRYLTHKGIIPLIGTTSQMHMVQDLAIFGFTLTQPILEAIDGLI